MKKAITLICIFLFFHAHSQIKVDFENFNLPVNSGLNGSDLSGGFTSGNVFLYNYYNTQFMYWGGWAISSKTDTMTNSFTNDLSAIAGKGAENSKTYAVSYGRENTMVVKGNAKGKPIKSISFTNGTYAALSMKEGDAFAKKFGGITGNDKDYFYITIKSWSGGKLGKDSVDFYLADYRFEDNSKDYIVKTWKNADLSSLGNVDSLSFVLHSSDIGAFGINTPTYFCLDNVMTSEVVATNDINETDIVIYPNPTSDFIYLKAKANVENYSLYDLSGRLLKSEKYFGQKIYLEQFPPNTYILRIVIDNKSIYRKIVKM